MKFAEAEIQSGEEVILPLNLMSGVNPGDQLSRLTFSVHYNTDTLTLVDVTAPPGSIFEGVSLHITPNPGSVTVETGTPGIYANENRLLDFRFRAGETDSTVSFDISPYNISMLDAVCYYGVMEQEKIIIRPRPTSVDRMAQPLPGVSMTV